MVSAVLGRRRPRGLRGAGFGVASSAARTNFGASPRFVIVLAAGGTWAPVAALAGEGGEPLPRPSPSSKLSWRRPLRWLTSDLSAAFPLK
jgi:hypothetical protein